MMAKQPKAAVVEDSGLTETPQPENPQDLFANTEPMMDSLEVRYIGTKNWEVDQWTGSGLVWHFSGQVQPMPKAQALQLVSILPTEFEVI